MYKKICLYFILFIPGSLFGQNQSFISPDFWKKYTEALVFDLKLDPLALKKTDFHFRFWSIGQVIDVYKDDYNVIHGEITNYAKEYDEMNLGKRTFHSSKLFIEPEDASDIYQLILRSGLNSFPAGEVIDGREKETRTFVYIVERIDSGKYSFKYFPLTAKHRSSNEAITIQPFIARLDQIAKLKKAYKSFSETIPFWCYTKGTQEVICRKNW
jgi:hypothetical protein